MRCPKCSYLSYEDVARCRNCGYDFALAAPRADAADAPALDSPGEPRAWQEPPFRGTQAPTDLLSPVDEGSAVDLPLFEPPDPPTQPDRPEPAGDAGPSVHREAGGHPEPAIRPDPPGGHPERPGRAEPPGRREASGRPDVAGRREPPPMTIPPVAPPLVVRRKIDVPRPPVATTPGRAAHRTPAAERPALDFDEPSELDRTLAHAPVPASEAEPVPDSDEPESSGVGGRLLAGVVDMALLLGIDTVVVWLTLRMLDLTLDDWRVLPLAPLVGFLFLLDTSYLVTFTTASGQTIGKMMTGLRVADERGGRVPFGHAVVRSVVALLCALPAGLGLLPILFDAHGRGLHDRVAGTRVVDAR